MMAFDVQDQKTATEHDHENVIRYAQICLETASRFICLLGSGIAILRVRRPSIPAR